jgi:hypothetical protein
MEIRAFQPQDEAAVIAFYNSLGYGDDEVVGLGKRLIADH